MPKFKKDSGQTILCSHEGIRGGDDIKHLLHRLDNIKTGRKLLLIYFIGSFLPLAVLSVVFGFSVSGRIERFVMERMDRTSISLRKDIAGNMAGAFWTINWIGSNQEIRHVLLEGASDPIDYLERYAAIDLVLKQIYAVHPEIENITVYHDNEAIPDGGLFLQIRSEDSNLSWMEGTDRQAPGARTTVTGRQDRLFLTMFRTFRQNTGSRTLNYVVRIDVSRDRIHDLLSKETDAIYQLLDGEGRLLATNSPDIPEGNRQNTNSSAMNREVPKNRRILVGDFGDYGYLGGWTLKTSIPRSALLPELSSVLQMNLLAIIACLTVSAASILLVSRSITRRLYALTHHMSSRKEALTPIEMETGLDEIGVTIRSFNDMADTINLLVIERHESQIRQSHLELENANSRLYAMYAQINPHFLYNTLNTIRMKCIMRRENATAGILAELARMFRYLSVYGEEFPMFQQEADFVKAYLAIQQDRFEERLTYSIELDSSLLDASIPRMMLQPFVENACVHGIELNPEGGSIQVEAHREPGRMVFRIEDDGPGMTEEALARLLEDIRTERIAGESIGITNVCNRLRHYYGKSFVFQCGNRSTGGFEVVLILPLS